MKIWKLDKLRRMFQRKAMILMYHRIAELPSDPWQLAVSPSNFAEQLEVLQKSGRVIAVNELVHHLRKKSIPRKAICITFDDGYRDNYLAAKPLLEKFNCPATFFIATGSVDQEQQFWWDELETILLHSNRLPEIFSMAINGEEVKYEFHSDGVLTGEEQLKHKSWTWPDKAPTERCELYLLIWERLKPLPYDKLQSTLKKVKEWAGVTDAEISDNLPMQVRQINDILRQPLLDIGIHTVTHPALSFHSHEIQQDEIAGSKQFLETTFSRTMTTIAYPYGNYNKLTLDIVEDMNLKAAFTTEERVVTNSDNPYRLGRFQVKNWNGEEFEKQIFKWISF